MTHQPHAHPSATDHSVDPVAFWEDLYQEREHRWSGAVNASLEAEVTQREPGRALDLGCGEGGDALWLARHGWEVTAVDISRTALDRGERRAREVELSDRITWIQADLVTWEPEDEFDLVVSCFLQSPIDFPREDILRRATRAVAPGGDFIVIGHGAVPPWSEHRHEDASLPGADEVVASLELVDGAWSVRTARQVDRPATGPDGHETTLVDSVVAVRRV